MENLKISTEDLVEDIRRGLTYGLIRNKYLLTEDALDFAFEKLVQAGLVRKEGLPIKAVLVKRRLTPPAPRQTQERTLRTTIIESAVLGCLVLIFCLYSLLTCAPQQDPSTSAKLASSDYEKCRALNAERCRNHRQQLKSEQEAKTRGESYYDADQGFLERSGDEMKVIMMKMEFLNCDKHSDIDWKCRKQ